MERVELIGTEILVCKDSAEAKAIWKSHPEDRHLICTEDETWAHGLDSPKQLQEWLDKKQLSPGTYL